MIAMFALLLAADVRAIVVLDPKIAQIGEPVVVSLVIERPSAILVEPPKIEPGVKDSWVFLEALGTRREAKPDAPGTLIETTSWRAFALESEAQLPTIEVSFTVDGAPQKILATGPAPLVAQALQAGEDAPRPMKGFREPVEWTGGGLRLVVIGSVLFALLGGALAFRIVRRRRLRARPVPLPTAADELERLTADARDTAANRDVVFALTRIARGAVDAATAENRASRTDEEWLALVSNDTRIPESARSAASRLVERAERVKYAGEQPTRFATAEALADARAIVEAVAPRKAA